MPLSPSQSTVAVSDIPISTLQTEIDTLLLPRWNRDDIRIWHPRNITGSPGGAYRHVFKTTVDAVISSYRQLGWIVSGQDFGPYRFKHPNI